MFIYFELLLQAHMNGESHTNKRTLLFIWRNPDTVLLIHILIEIWSRVFLRLISLRIFFACPFLMKICANWGWSLSWNKTKPLDEYWGEAPHYHWYLSHSKLCIFDTLLISWINCLVNVEILYNFMLDLSCRLNDAYLTWARKSISILTRIVAWMQNG